MANFHFELVSPERLVYSGEVESVLVTSTEGEMQVMRDHAPVMAMLKPGVVRFTDGGGARHDLFVRGGFADMANNTLTILAELAVALADVDAKLIDAEIKDAEEDLADAKVEQSRQQAAERLEQLRELKASLSL
ncbi:MULTISPECIES: F0F1 ATP synthase subunit epsilon [unclassified Beijerinckia]|uniref:F0F1 ATP synthase subunit epsilon n=1 Tax=unclassified Beijerinckia TaxID=2638183 RepID=UPI00089C370F|nr:MULTISPECIES: F0F1 ATP synthase subunit epsilon [unclassified Beijerinckia]MDH7798493.1 F-type H+-transporting ATPase subunit epsilon [Beijerinckia sp. GAS462]SED22737.1 ATP synthase F1 subcomplex epsilon subunit [Beijerinckia sp. 28-YEA-48]